MLINIECIEFLLTCVHSCISSTGGSTVPFRSIRQAPWLVTALLKFWFRQDAKMAVTACFFRHIGKIFEDFCGIYVEIVLLSWFHWNHERRPLDCSGKFFSIFARFIYDFFNGFGRWPKSPWPPWLFGVWKWPVTRDCRIDRNGTVTTNVSSGDMIKAFWNEFLRSWECSIGKLTETYVKEFKW